MHRHDVEAADLTGASALDTCGTTDAGAVDPR
jgi:hypothetical protein